MDGGGSVMEPRARVVVGGEALIDLIIDQAGGFTPAAGGGLGQHTLELAKLRIGICPASRIWQHQMRVRAGEPECGAARDASQRRQCLAR